MKLGLAGKYTIYKQKVAMKDGIPLLDGNGNQVLLGEQEKVAEFENLITNNGLDLIGKKALCQYMIVSSDNTAPSITDTTINMLGQTTLTGTGDGALNKNVTTAPYWVSYQCVKRFGAGVGTGNITKIAISNNSTGTDLFSIALVKDGNGNPTTITKLPDEILDISYELKQYLNTNDVTTSMTISGVTHTVTNRLMNLNGWSGTWVHNIIAFEYLEASDKGISTITQHNTGNYIAKSLSSYNLGSYKITYIPSLIGIGACNFATGINVILLRGVLFYQLGITPPIMKTSNQTLQLPPITISWGRYEGA